MNAVEIVLLCLVFFFAFMTWQYRDRYLTARRAGILWRKRAKLAGGLLLATVAAAWWWNRNGKK